MPDLELINPRTGQTIRPGSKIHTVHGSHPWTYSHLRKINDGTHHVHVTRTVKGSRGRTFKGHKEFHPSVFGLDVRVSLTWERRAVSRARHAVHKIDDYLLAGAFAIIPLAFFEHYQMAGTITEAVTLGLLGDGGH